MSEIKGRGAQTGSHSRFSSIRYIDDESEEELIPSDLDTTITSEFPKTIINKVKSPDVGMVYSLNPYQGCEHGCVYCYARNTHEFYDLGAGLDFETKLFVKPDAPKLMRNFLMRRGYTPDVISLSGNTDCYQPAERKLKITRNILQVLSEFRNPTSIITKNSLVLRDADILTDMAQNKLVRVYISLTTLNESLRRQLEPRTVSSEQRLKVIEKLTLSGIPVGIMTAPVIPGLNSEEIPELIRAGADHGAVSAGLIIVRLNGAVENIFTNWLRKKFPARYEKVMNQIRSCHGGTANDSRFGVRMKGEGKIAESLNKLHRLSVSRYMKNRMLPEYDFTLFRIPGRGKQVELFT